jgi:tetratricopeptide (TPR) repeat protein
MALRLTSTSQQPAAGAPGGQARSPEALAAHARALLSAGDLAGYLALFATAAEIADRQRGYQAHVLLLQMGMATAAEVGDAAAVRIFAATADAALRLLQTEPREPVLLNYAGIACYELWMLDAASALFKAARRLDPGLANIDRNLAGLAARKRTAGRQTRPLHAAAAGLARRAKAIAAAARPATGLTLSLCMIVRDEEQMLPRCLEAVASTVDEIVIVDTGSTDATIEIARSFGARVIERPWTGSFAEARNASFDAATGDWLLYLDADEVLVAQDAQRLRSLTGHTWHEGMYLVETSYVGELGDGGAVVNNALRMFRNRPEYRFDGRLHEQIIQTLPTFAPGRVAHTPVRILHYGYLGAIRNAKDKSRRNIELLRAQAAEGADSAFFHFNLGSEHAAAGEPALAVTELRRAWQILGEAGSRQTSEFAAALLVRLTMVLRLSGRLDEAAATATEGLAIYPDLTDLVLEQASIARSRGDDAEMAALLARCIELGDAPAGYGAAVGAGTFVPRVALAERHLERGETRAARELLAWCVEHHPEFLAVAGPYAAALLRDGVDPVEVVTELERLETVTPAVRVLLAGALRERGVAAIAEQQYRLALTASPSNAAARLALAETLLARGAWEEAAAEAMLVTEDDPYAGLACRIALCGLIGRGDPAAARAAMERAARAGLPSAEQEVFRGWLAIAAGAPAPDGLGIASVPMLGVILDLLLRGGDTERFAALAPALRGSRLPAREQRQLLAEMFLGQGMLADAGREWMAVCADAPDARALLGLARVAASAGMAEDAITFASGALELEPDCRPARELLQRLAPPARGRPEEAQAA